MKTRLYAASLDITTARALAATADLFVEMAEKLDPTGTQALTFELPIAQTILAELLGTSAVHINRVLRRLQDMGIMRLKEVMRKFLIEAKWKKLAIFIGSRVYMTESERRNNLMLYFRSKWADFKTLGQPADGQPW